MRNSILHNLGMIKGFLALSSIIILIYGLQQAQTILVPFILAIFLSSVVAYPMEWLIRKRFPRIVAVLIVVTLSIGILVGIGSVVGSSISEFLSKTDSYEQNLTIMYNKYIGITDVGDNQDLSLLEMGRKNILSELENSISPATLMKWTTSILGNIQNIFKNTFLILISMIFMLLEVGSFKKKLEFLDKVNPEAKKTVNRFTASMRSYIGLKFLVSLMTGVIITVWVSLVGLDFPFLWGMIAFLLNFIPTIGSIIAAVPAILLALVQLSFGEASFIALGYVLTNMTIGNIVEPRIMGDGLGLSTLVVFISLVFWGWVFGLTGMLLAVPLTMAVKIALESSKSTEHIGVMLSSYKELKKYKENE